MPVRPARADRGVAVTRLGPRRATPGRRAALIARGLFSFGLWTRDWTKVRYPEEPSLGNIEADFFEPWKWKTEYPQPAFDQIDAADAFWAASIAARFTDDTIAAIVGSGRLSDPNAARFLTEVIIRRRDKVVAHWIRQTNPLDRFAVSRDAAGVALTFDNAAIRLGAAPAGASYEIGWAALDNAAGTTRPIGADVRVADARAAVPEAAWGGPDEAGFRYAVASISTQHPAFAEWNRPVRATLRSRGAAVDVVGIERPADRPGDR